MPPGSGRWSGHRHPPHTELVSRQLLDQLELGIVGVLELVDQDVGEPFAVPAEDVRLFGKERHCLVDHVIEVEQVLRPFVFLVGLVDAEQVGKFREILLFVFTGISRLSLCPCLPLRSLPMFSLSLLLLPVPFLMLPFPFFRSRYASSSSGLISSSRKALIPSTTDSITSTALFPTSMCSNPNVIDMLKSPHQLVGPADDPRRKREPRVEHVVLQHREGEGVEGADGEIARVCLLLQPFEHFVSGFVGEGEGEDVLRFYALLDEVEDFFGDYSGFAGTGTGED